MIFLKVFLFGFVIDLMYVLYILSVTNGRYLLAALASMLMAAPAIFGYLDIYESRILALPYLLGLGSGSYFGLLFGKYIERKRNGIQQRSD